MRINLNIEKSMFNEKFYPLMFDYSHRWEVLLGSAGSGKSYSITQKIIIRCCRETIRVLVCRRYGTTIRQTVFALFKEVLKSWEITKYIKINESDYRITFPNGSEILFTGLDEETKLLSLSNISTVWVEEAFECSKDIIDQLNLRMRGQALNQQIILSFNPISKQSWLYDFVNNPPESFIFHHSTYKDNKFLSEEYVKTLEELKIRNPRKAEIYCYGNWGIDADGLVLTNWTIERLDAMQLAKQRYEHRCGMDEGYTDPSAIIESFYNAEKKEIYVTNEFYESGQTLDDLLRAIRAMNLTKTKIQCDSAAVRMIDFFKRNYINAVPCIKGQGSVEARIAFLQNSRIIVDDRCEHMIDNLSNFSYEKDKKTNKYIDGKYTHEFSHAIDALGYAYSDLYTQGRLRTIDKSILSL